MTPLGYAALALAKRGLRVFPVKRNKKPAIDANLASASTDEGVIRGWWNTVDWNIGVACGPGSNMWAVDLDGPEHEAVLRGLEERHGRLPATIEVITGGGGRHLYFSWPSSGVDIRNTQDRDDFFDVRGQGGFVIVPPSLHESGRRYCWSVDSADKFAAAPEWLIDAVAKSRSVDGTTAATPPEVWRTFVDEYHSGSHRGHAIAKLAGLLLRKYLDPLVILSLCHLFNEAKCREPLDAAEVVAIVNRIARAEAQRREQPAAGRETGEAT